MPAARAPVRGTRARERGTGVGVRGSEACVRGTRGREQRTRVRVPMTHVLVRARCMRVPYIRIRIGRNCACVADIGARLCGIHVRKPMTRVRVASKRARNNILFVARSCQLLLPLREGLDRALNVAPGDGTRTPNCGRRTPPASREAASTGSSSCPSEGGSRERVTRPSEGAVTLLPSTQARFPLGEAMPMVSRDLLRADA